MKRTYRANRGMSDVYRCFGANGELLYVGISTNGYARLEVHRRGATWWPSVTRIRVEQYRNRREAMRVEAIAIFTESPLHNLSHYDTIAVGEYPEPIETDEWEVG